MTNRKEAMKWWQSLSSLQKTQICDINTDLIGHVRRWETLTGREIELIYEDECDSDKDIIELAFKNIGTQRSPFGL